MEMMSHCILLSNELQDAVFTEKVKLSMSLTKHYTMKTYGRVHVYTQVFRTSVLAGGEWSNSRPCRFTPGG
jgi:hypothetical protein